MVRMEKRDARSGNGGAGSLTWMRAVSNLSVSGLSGQIYMANMADSSYREFA